MDEEQIQKDVAAEYKKLYPKWGPVRVTQIVPDTFDGSLVVVTAKDDEGDEVEEICFVFNNGRVQVFESTEQMAIFLDSRAKFPWYQRVFATSTLSGLVFLLAIIFIFISGFFDHYNDKVTALLGTVIGAAAGFYFGASRK